jgi:hypothetical protein
MIILRGKKRIQKEPEKEIRYKYTIVDFPQGINDDGGSQVSFMIHDTFSRICKKMMMMRCRTVLCVCLNVTLMLYHGVPSRWHRQTRRNLSRVVERSSGNFLLKRRPSNHEIRASYTRGANSKTFRAEMGGSEARNSIF